MPVGLVLYFAFYVINQMDILIEVNGGWLLRRKGVVMSVTAARLKGPSKKFKVRQQSTINS